MIISSISAGWLLARSGVWLVVLARASGLAWSAPAWGTPALGWRVRLGLAVFLTAALVPAVESAVEPPAGPAGLGQACLVEALVGAALGWTAGLVVAGARQAGELVGAQAGLAPAALLDPEADGELTAPGHLYGLVALATFLALDGPLALVRALVDSYRLVPAGPRPWSAWPGAGPAVAIWAFDQVGQALALALRAAAPVALALILTGVALGLLGRAAPALQLLALAFPVRTAAGLVLVLLGLAGLVATLTTAWARLPLLGGGP